MLEAKEKLDSWQPYRLEDLLNAHAILMRDLVQKPGCLRTGGVGVYQDGKVVHMASPAHLVHDHLNRLIGWLGQTDEHPLVASCVFHYEFGFIHPFADANGRMDALGRRSSSVSGNRFLPICRWKRLSVTDRPNTMPV